MKKTVNRLIKENIILLIPLIIYAIYKNGYLIFNKGLINIFSMFKPLYLVLISIGIKCIIDLIKNKKVLIDYNLLYVILISMLMPYNINIILYIVLFSTFYLLSLFLNKYISINKVCLVYLLIISIHFIFNDFTFMNIMEKNYTFNFEFLDYLFGRNIGGISTSSIILSLGAFIYLINDYYYKKNIPFIINLVYLFLAFIYFFITNNSSILLNSELIFASIFIAPIPEFSPCTFKGQVIYSILIGVFSFIISVLFNSIIAIYISIFLINLLNILVIRQKQT